MSELPVPPAHLATRVGPGRSEDATEAYLLEGREVIARVERSLPAGWTWSDRAVLDFGCGAGRVLRHLVGRVESLAGCDIHAESIAWVRENLPGVHAFVNAYRPPLKGVPAASYDLVYATSVFTHIGEHWASWLVEMHRVLRPGGLLVSSWLGEAMWEALLEEPYDEDAVGMTVRHGHTAEDAWIFHSEWWLREHWGRAFEVLDVWRPEPGEVTHGYITLRRRDHPITAAEIERCDPAEPRELAAAQTNVRWLTRENRELAALVRAAESHTGRAALRIATGAAVARLRRLAR